MQIIKTKRRERAEQQKKDLSSPKKPKQNSKKIKMEKTGKRN